MTTTRKRSGAYYTPEDVARTLVSWLCVKEDERLLDPSCGDGRFLAAHPFSVGIEQDEAAAAEARLRAPSATVHQGDFFVWASETSERFECAAGNPPFIRYQTFAGETRKRAQLLCQRLGASFSGLASSWAPFLVASASLLKPGGRMAFVLPAEIGHAPYAAPLLEYLVGHFSKVRIIAIHKKLFPDLSEDCWLLFAAGAGGKTDVVEFSELSAFTPCQDLPPRFISVSFRELSKNWKGRLRPFLLPSNARELYMQLRSQAGAQKLGDLVSIGIGYVSGANDFFHLRPSVAAKLLIPEEFLQPAVRNSRSLPNGSITKQTITAWKMADQPFLLLRLAKSIDPPRSVMKYLDTEMGKEARTAYKCRTRDPWWSVPDVTIPDLMLTYMSGSGVSIVRNAAGCSCTNSLHALRVKPGTNPTAITKAFDTPLTSLSCEIEGHPLGGGMLKIEVREAAEIIISPRAIIDSKAAAILGEATSTMRTWRHHG